MMSRRKTKKNKGKIGQDFTSKDDFRSDSPLNKVKRKANAKTIKQRVRSIKRLLAKPDLPATVRVSQERMLDFMQSKLDEAEQCKKDTKIIKKYKMVKFFEKRKLWRQHRAVMKELNDSPNPERAKELKQLERKLLLDLNYVEYFPCDRKYISLFPAEPYTNQTVLAQQEELHKCVNGRVNAGELPQAKFNNKDSSTKNNVKSRKKLNKITQDHCGHLDRRKETRTETNSSEKTSGLEEDDFFIDTCGNLGDVE